MAKILDPQQISFLEYYLDVKSETFSNAYQSAVKANYSKEYAENITSIMPKWLSETIGDSKLLSKTIRNLDKFLDDTKNPNIQADITKFVAKTIGKNKFGDSIDVTSKGKKIDGFNFITNGSKHNTNAETGDSVESIEG